MNALKGVLCHKTEVCAVFLLLVLTVSNASGDDGFSSLRDPAAPSEPEGDEETRQELLKEESPAQTGKEELIKFGLSGKYKSKEDMLSSKTAVQYRADKSRWSMRAGGFFQQEFPKRESEKHARTVQANLSVAPSFLRTNRFTFRTGLNASAKEDSMSNDFEKGLEWGSEASFETLKEHLASVSATIGGTNASNWAVEGELGFFVGHEVGFLSRNRVLKGLNIGATYNRSSEDGDTSDELTGTLEMSAGRALFSFTVGTGFEDDTFFSLSLNYSAKFKPQISANP